MYVLYALMFQVGIGIGRQQATEGAGQEPAAQNAFGADGHHCGNTVVLRLRQSAVEQ